MTTTFDPCPRAQPAPIAQDSALAVVRREHDGPWRIVSCDAGVTALLGYPADELTGSTHDPADLIHADDVHAIAPLSERVRDSGTGTCRCRIRAHDGSWHRVEMSVLVGDRDPAGEPIQLVVSLTDLGTLAQAKGVLALTERVLEMIAKGSAMHEVLDELCACTERFVDNAVCSVMLTSTQGPLRIAAGPSLPPEAIEAFDRLEPGEQAACCGTAVYTGEPVYIADIRTDPRWSDYARVGEHFGLRSGWSVPIRSDTGDILGSFGICRTVTGLPSPIQVQLLHTASHLAGIAIMRDTLESQQHEALTRYRAIFDTARDAIFLKDGQGRYLAINPAMAALCQTTPDAMIGHHDREIFDEWSIRFVRAVDERVMAGEAVELQHAWSFNGADRIFDVSKVPLRDARGTVCGICGIARDITERIRAKERHKEMEDRVQRAGRLERLGLFTGGLAHDFGNLMLAIRGNTELLRRLIIDRHHDAARDAVARIDESVEMASALTRRILAYAGRGGQAPEPINLGHIARETIRMIRPAIPASIDLNCVVEPALATITADPVQMRQVFMNLLTNAAESIGHAKGSVLVRVHNQSLAQHSPTSMCVGTTPHAQRGVAIEVCDDGPGISEADRQRIFEPFFSTKNGGRGLGLAAVLGIVQAHEGVICLDESPMGGACLRVILPADVQQTPRSDAPDTATPTPAS